MKNFNNWSGYKFTDLACGQAEQNTAGDVKVQKLFMVIGDYMAKELSWSRNGSRAIQQIGR